MNELDLIFNYYNDQLIEFEKLKQSNNYNMENNYELDTGKNENIPCHKLYYFMCDIRNFGGFPKILDDEKFEKLIEIQPVMYHGFEEYEHGANYLWDFYYHYGDGFYGGGFYATSSKKEAINYTCNDVRINNDRVLSLVVNSKNYIKYDELTRLMNCLLEGDADGYIPLLRDDNFYNSIQEKQEHKILEEKRAKMFKDWVEYIYSNFKEVKRHELINDLSSNIGVLAVYLGFDYMTRKNNHVHHSDHNIIYNRNAVVVSESEFQKFMDNSGEKYKGLRFER